MLIRAVAFAAFFVAPMRCHAKFVELVHFKGADLHFDAFVFGPYDYGVQRFVAVAFGVGDVVVKLAGDGLKQAVDDAERGIAFGDGVHQNAHRADVV